MSILFGTGETQPTFDDYKMENGFFNPNAKLLIPVVAIKSSAPTNAKVHLNISNTEK